MLAGISAGIVAAAVLLLVLRYFFFQGPVLPPLPLPSTRIIDIHCHCAGIGAGGSGCFVSEGMVRNFKYSFLLRAFGTSEAQLQEHGDALGLERINSWLENSRYVDGAVILAMDAIYSGTGEIDRDRTIFYVPNSFVTDHIGDYGNLYFGASVHPHRRDALERLEWCKENGAVLLKWLPSIQLMDPSDRRHEPFYRKLVELDLPLLCHLGDESSFHWSVDKFSEPALIEFPLELGVTVIAAHVGCAGKSDGKSNFSVTVDLMGRFPNLWADISALSLINRKHFLTKALRIESIHRRLLFGTDHPLTNLPIVSPYYFPLHFRIRQMRKIAAISNPWDRDVAIKQALGVPPAVFSNPAKLLNLK
jgi:predicted TIM-barrel fold metal-dependent hydrolase